MLIYRNILAATFSFLCIGSVSAQVVKCTSQDGTIKYASKADALKLVNDGTFLCDTIRAEKSGIKQSPQTQNYENWAKSKSQIKTADSVKLSDLYEYISKNSPDTLNKDSTESWLEHFPPYSTGFTIVYPSEVKQDDRQKDIFKGNHERCSIKESHAVLIEKNLIREKYIGQNAFGVAKEVSKKTEVLFCVRDENYIRAWFDVTDINYKKTDLAIVARARLANGPHSDFYEFKPTINDPIDVSRTTIIFELDADEYMLVHKPSGRILESIKVN